MRRYKKFRRIKRKKPIYRYRVFWVVAGGIVLTGFFIYATAFAPFVRVQGIRVEGAEKVDAKVVADFAWTKIPRSIVLVNTQKLQREIEQEFIQIDAAKVRRTLSRTIAIDIAERKKIAMWCSGDSPQECFAIDAKGVAFEKSQAQGAFAIYSSEAPSTETLGALRSFQEKAAAKFASASVVSSLQIQLQAEEGWKAFINPKEDIAWQAAKLNTVLEKRIPEGKRGRVEYVDLRFGDQAYIKYR